MRSAVKSRNVGANLRAAAEELRDLEAARENASQRAFGTLEKHHATLARLAIQSTGDRQRAIRWMCMRQRAFDSRSAYDLLAEGDVDTVWDRLCGDDKAVMPTRQAGGAY